MQFNVSVLGRIDLDDTDHIIASDHLISVAREAGTFVGDAAKNIIDFRASYDDYRMEIENEDWTAEWRAHVRERLVTALNILEGTDAWTEENVLEDNDFVMTNLDGGGYGNGLPGSRSCAGVIPVLCLWRRIGVDYYSAVTRVQCPEPTIEHMTGKLVNEL